MTMKHRSSRGFTLVELTVAIAIVALLSSLALPSYQKAMDRARTTQCGQNLRQIGLAVLAAAQDNDNKYPEINDPSASPPYYDDPGVQNMADTLKAYGIVGPALRCPSDVLAQNYYAKYGNSYQWYPMSDEEAANTNSINIYTMRGQIFQRPPARVRIVTDYGNVHYNRCNALYADGHVKVIIK